MSSAAYSVWTPILACFMKDVLNIGLIFCASLKSRQFEIPIGKIYRPLLFREYIQHHGNGFFF